VGRDQPIRPWELYVDFTVALNVDGCAAIVVEVRDADPWPLPDRVIADNLGTTSIPCECFKRNVERRFRIYADVNPANPPFAAPPGGEVLIPHLMGRWPSSDGPFDDTLELFAVVTVFLCNQECVDGRCKPLEDGLEGFSRIGRTDTRDRPRSVVIRDGIGAKEGADLIEKGAGAVGGALKSVAPPPLGGGGQEHGSKPGIFKSMLPLSDDPYTGLLAKRLFELEERVDRLGQRRPPPEAEAEPEAPAPKKKPPR
jgi:hypothetical protein